ncbi:hypothetical protein B0T17DRAFT_619967 [Bombardia bombarda]|uniref:Uncharacterized protein n=1 Tax=Bombardia bombarda TaxID=252184 RepID=A0AA39WGV5_9PEZI|nr:hypothetical protein B0T17DRAFT_619967 [Bombardia bombarda]
MNNNIAISKTERLLEKLHSSDDSPASRSELLGQIEEIRFSVQQPCDAMNHYVLIIINACSELGVFDPVPLDGAASTDEIATTVKIDVSIICALHGADNAISWKASSLLPMDRYVVRMADYLRSHTRSKLVASASTERASSRRRYLAFSTHLDIMSERW